MFGIDRGGVYLIEISKDDELEIVRLYKEERYSLRRIAKIFKTNHHRVKRILEKYDIEITQNDRIMESFSEEHKRKISMTSKGRKFPNRVMSKESKYKNMAGHIRFNVDFEFLKRFDDIEKLSFLNRCISNRDKRWSDISDEWYKQYLLKFYNDENFNKFYLKYKETKDKYFKPSIDHIIPKSRGGDNNLDNLRFLSWFENRCKDNMSLEKWEIIKKNIKEYFI